VLQSKWEKLYKSYFYMIIFFIMTDCGHKEHECQNLQIFGSVVVWAKGQIVIPSEVRKMIWLQPGDTLIVTAKHGKAIGLIKSDDLEQFISMMQEELEIMKKKALD